MVFAKGITSVLRSVSRSFFFAIEIGRPFEYFRFSEILLQLCFLDLMTFVYSNSAFISYFSPTSPTWLELFSNLNHLTFSYFNAFVEVVSLSFATTFFEIELKTEKVHIYIYIYIGLWLHTCYQFQDNCGRFPWIFRSIVWIVSDMFVT